MAAGLTIGGVPCSIFVEDGIREFFPAGSGATANVTFKCAWSNRYQLVRALRGYVNPFALSFVYVIPYQYPTSPNLFCTGIGEIRGLSPYTDASGWLQYKTALVPAEFSVPNFQGFPFYSGSGDPSGLTFTTTRFRVSSEVFSPPGGSFYYTSGTNAGQPVEESHLGFIRPRVEISMTRHRFPGVPLNSLMNTEGGIVNNGPITFADKTFPTGCLLFTGMNTEPITDGIEGVMLQELEFTFLGNSTTDWNYFMDRTGTYVPINTKSDGSGNPPFAYQDFTYLFGLTY